jgi:hypothetical protein
MGTRNLYSSNQQPNNTQLPKPVPLDVFDASALGTICLQSQLRDATERSSQQTHGISGFQLDRGTNYWYVCQTRDIPSGYD